jgi:hypothetical protein
MVSGMRYAPFWAGMEAEAHGLIADYALIGDGRFDEGHAADGADADAGDGRWQRLRATDSERRGGRRRDAA